MAEELLPIFIGIFFAFIGLLITFILGMLGFYTKLVDIIKSLTKIEEHTSKIAGLEDKMFELRLTLEKGKLSSVPITLPKSKVELVVKVKNRTKNTTQFEVAAKEPIPKAVVDKCYPIWQHSTALRDVESSTYYMFVTFNTGDAKTAATYTRKFLDILDEAWFRERNWEDIFKAEMTKGKE